MGVGSLQKRYYLGTRNSTGTVTSQSPAQSLVLKKRELWRLQREEVVNIIQPKFMENLLRAI